MAALGIGGTAAAGGLLAVTVCFSSGCSSLGYYAQSVRGHLNLVEAARPVSQWLADPATPPALKARLALSQQIRDFAVSNLAEPDNASYRRYADLRRPAAVWNVVAAPELSLTLRTWCFAVVGCVAYRGYYDRADAEALADRLRGEGLDVSVYPVSAYSTLGWLPAFDWLADPLLNTFIDAPEAELARLVFHELAHQIAYAPGDTAFNESFATTVEKLGAERWLAERAGAEAREVAAQVERRRRDFRALTQRVRGELEALYAGELGDAARRERKAALLAGLREEHAALKAGPWAGYAGYDRWFDGANNASLGVLSTYGDLVPAFERLFEREGRDFPRFYAAVRRLAALPKAERRAGLAQ